MEKHTLPALNQVFTLTFNNQNTARAIRVPKDNDPAQVLGLFGLQQAQPTIFVSGGASYMSDEDKQRVGTILQGVADFAQEKGAVVIDGGTESGVMQMVGDARNNHNHTFPLIGVSPLGKVSFPGYKNPNEEAYLEDSHSHFVLVSGENWGDESQTIINLTNAVCHRGKKPAIGILINGGRIAMHEVYLASTTQNKIPMLVLEGSGRTADEISTAFRTGKTQREILRAILAGGDIQLIAADEGMEVVRQKLMERFTI